MVFILLFSKNLSLTFSKNFDLLTLIAPGVAKFFTFFSNTFLFSLSNFGFLLITFLYNPNFLFPVDGVWNVECSKLRLFLAKFCVFPKLFIFEPDKLSKEPIFFPIYLLILFYLNLFSL